MKLILLAIFVLALIFAYHAGQKKGYALMEAEVEHNIKTHWERKILREGHA